MNFPTIFHQSDVENILQNTLHITQRYLFAEITTQTFFLAPICERVKRICSGGIHFKYLTNFRSFLIININTARFGVVQIANRSPARPYAISYLLPQTSLHILSQIIYKIFTLAESDVQHK